MNADKHTPGPWSEVTYEGDSYATIIGPDGDECIAILDGNIPSKAEQEANARLIAAAPLLLTMLRRLSDEIRMSERGMACVALLTLEQVDDALRSVEV